MTVGAQGETEHGAVLDQQDVGRRLRDAPRGEADDDDAPLPRDAAQRRVEGVPAYRVVDHVAAAPAGELIDAFP